MSEQERDDPNIKTRLDDEINKIMSTMAEPYDDDRKADIECVDRLYLMALPMVEEINEYGRLLFNLTNKDGDNKEPEVTIKEREYCTRVME